MAYNYDRDFVQRHQETVDQLKELARTGDTARMEFTDARQLRASQRLINNLLRCMALYDPAYVDLRQRVRTWTKYEREQWVLYVGAPQQKLPGASPLRTASTSVGGGIGETQNNHLDYPIHIGTSGEWTAFGAKMMGMATHILTVRAEFKIPPKLDRVDVFDGWFAVVKSPTTIIFQRGERPDVTENGL